MRYRSNRGETYFMNRPPSVGCVCPFRLKRTWWIVIATLVIQFCGGTLSVQAACDKFAPGARLGTVFVKNLDEASGIAASRRNAGVLWTHNDGAGGAVYALGPKGALLATFFLNRAVIDTEDIAVGPGPESGVSYLYVGDIGGNEGRRQVQILRVREPFVDPGWYQQPRTLGFGGVDRFTLNYPDGSFDAESLMVDPISQDVFVVTKQTGSARVYRANLNSLANGSTTNLTFVRAVLFANASGGDISADGTQIVLRRENFAALWARDETESLDAALSRASKRVPVVGEPLEENGEGIAFLPNGKGYVTISEGDNPGIYFFRTRCPEPPQFTSQLQDKTTFQKGSVTFRSKAAGYPKPTYRWTFNGATLPKQKRNVLILRHLKLEESGEYVVTATNRSGTAESSATLTVVVR